MTIPERIDSLKTDLLNEVLSFEQLFQKHIIDTQSFYFNSILQDTGK